jgi:hypothetical protein
MQRLPKSRKKVTKRNHRPTIYSKFSKGWLELWMHGFSPARFSKLEHSRKKNQENNQQATAPTKSISPKQFDKGV